MTRRVLCLGATAFIVACGVVYSLVMSEQGDNPAAWFLGVLTVAAAASLAGALTSRGRPYIASALLLTTAAMILSLPSVGLLLLPAVALTGVALAGGRSAGARAARKAGS